MKSKYDYDTIRDYLHGILDKETAREIRELIRNDEIARNIALGILQFEYEFNGNDEEIESYIEGLRLKQLTLIEGEHKVKWFSRDWVKLAAAILVIVVAIPAFYLITFPERPDDLVITELTYPYPLAVNDRGGSEGSAENAGYEFYMNGDYESAITSFNQVEKDVVDPASVTFYNGLSYLYTERYDEANTLLDSESLGSSRYAEQATWFHALALLKMNRVDEARNLLDYINRHPAHYKSKEALLILEKLN